MIILSTVLWFAFNITALRRTSTPKSTFYPASEYEQRMAIKTSAQYIFPKIDEAALWRLREATADINIATRYTDRIINSHGQYLL